MRSLFFCFTEHFACSYYCQGKIDQCQIISFLILKFDNISKLRIELKGILLRIPSNKVKDIYITFNPSAWYICDLLFTVSRRHWRKLWMDYSGAKGYFAPPSKIIGGQGCPLLPALHTPMFTSFNIDLSASSWILICSEYQQNLFLLINCRRKAACIKICRYRLKG